MANWLRKLQEAEEGEKKIYVIAGTILFSTIIISVWLTWFNSISPLAGVPGEGGNELANVAHPAPSQGFSLWESIRGFFGSLGSVFNVEREVIVKPGEQ